MEYKPDINLGHMLKALHTYGCVTSEGFVLKSFMESIIIYLMERDKNEQAQGEQGGGEVPGLPKG